MLLLVEHYAQSPFKADRGRYHNWAVTSYSFVPAHIESHQILHPLAVRKGTA